MTERVFCDGCGEEISGIAVVIDVGADVVGSDQRAALRSMVRGMPGDAAEAIGDSPFHYHPRCYGTGGVPAAEPGEMLRVQCEECREECEVEMDETGEFYCPGCGQLNRVVE